MSFNMNDHVLHFTYCSKSQWMEIMPVPTFITYIYIYYLHIICIYIWLYMYVCCRIKFDLIWFVVNYMPIIISRGAEGPGREILQRPPSVCLSVCLCLSVCPSIHPSVRPSVTFSFRTVTQKTHRCIFSKLCRYLQSFEKMHRCVFELQCEN